MCRLPGDRVGDRGLGTPISHQRSTQYEREYPKGSCQTTAVASVSAH